MENNSNQSLKTFLTQYGGQQILILTKGNLHYKTSNLKVYDDNVIFTDIKNNEIMLAISEISQVTKIGGGKDV